MSRADELNATRQYWNNQSKYMPRHERNVKFDTHPQIVHPHIIYDERVDHSAPRVYSAAYNPELVEHQLTRAWKEITHEEQLRLKVHSTNKEPVDLAARAGHSEASGKRVKALNPLEHEFHYHGGAEQKSFNVIGLPNL
jgi:hypothetical protein